MFVCLLVTFWPIFVNFDGLLIVIYLAFHVVLYIVYVYCGLNYLTFAKDYLTRQSPAVTMWCAQVLLLCVLLFSHFSFTNFERESIADHNCVRNSSYLPCYYNFTTTTIFTHKKIKRPYGYCLYYANSYASRQILLQGGDIETNPGPNASDINLKPIKVTPPTVRNSSISLCLINAQSIRNKTVDLVDYVYENKFDLVAITETWLRDIDDAIRVELCPDGYKFVDFPRVRCGGGGIGLLYKNNLRVTTIRSGEEDSFEYSELLVEVSSSRKLRVVIVYRPPYSEHHKISIGTFIRQFSNYMESVILSKEHLLVLGDFNIHLDVSDDADAVKFHDLLESLGLEQHVTKSTHIHGHILDLVITRKTENIIPFPPRSCSYFSDHTSVHFDIAIKKPPLQTKSISYRKIKAVDIDCFKHELASSVLCYNEPREHSVPEDLDRLVNTYNTTLTSMIDKHAPLTTKTVKARSQVPWYNHDIAAAKRKRRKAERIWRKTKAGDDLLLFKRLKNHVTYISNKARREFYAQFINENGNDQNRLFRATNALLHPKDAVCFPDYSDDTSLANDIGHFFYKKVINIRKELDAVVIDQCDSSRLINDPKFGFNQSLEKFEVLSTDMVSQLIQKLRPRSYAYITRGQESK